MGTAGVIDGEFPSLLLHSGFSIDMPRRDL